MQQQQQQASSGAGGGVSFGLASDLLQNFRRFTAWLLGLSAFSGYLERHAARENEAAWFLHEAHTPGVYERGLIAFRNHVLLSYWLRRELEQAVAKLIADTNPTCRQPGVDRTVAIALLSGLYTMVNEVDVRDDSQSVWQTRSSFRSSQLAVSLASWHSSAVKNGLIANRDLEDGVLQY